jgi:hypothetical protein
MRTRNIGPFLGALLVLLAVIILGDWDQPQGLSGLTSLAVAQAADNDDDDRDRKKKDHFACYEVKCFKKWDQDHKWPIECPKLREEVILFNQFTERERDGKKDDRDDEKDEGVEVVVERLRLLCVPTRKEHKDDHRPH